MPITFSVDPTKKASEPLSKTVQERSTGNDVVEFLKAACSNQAKICQEVLQASFAPRSNSVNGPDSGPGVESDSELENMMAIGGNPGGGLANVAVNAYNNHHHLVLRSVLAFLLSVEVILPHRLAVFTYLQTR
jgi:hypothetical protein